jgi:hypothetical protein
MQCAAALVAVAAPALPAQQDTTVGITAVRFYRAGGPETLVEVFCRIPLSGVAPLTASGNGAYRIALWCATAPGWIC